MYGWYSAKQADFLGTFTYEIVGTVSSAAQNLGHEARNGLIYVTMVTSTKTEPECEWGDVVFMGELGKFVRANEKCDLERSL